MKTLTPTILLILALPAAACQQQRAGQGSRMLLDSAATGSNVTIVRLKEPARPNEMMGDFSRLPIIMQTDIDALQRTPSKDVVYVKAGEAFRPSEQRR